MEKNLKLYKNLKIDNIIPKGTEVYVILSSYLKVEPSKVPFNTFVLPMKVATNKLAGL